jgi:hypothetical protein
MCSAIGRLCGDEIIAGVDVGKEAGRIAEGLDTVEREARDAYLLVKAHNAEITGIERTLDGTTAPGGIPRTERLDPTARPIAFRQHGVPVLRFTDAAELPQQRRAHERHIPRDEENILLRVREGRVESAECAGTDPYIADCADTGEPRIGILGIRDKEEVVGDRAEHLRHTVDDTTPPNALEPFGGAAEACRPSTGEEHPRAGHACQTCG